MQKMFPHLDQPQGKDKGLCPEVGISQKGLKEFEKEQLQVYV